MVESSEESEYTTISSRKANRSSDEVTWNFRRRDASDRSSQPHSAPTGVAAQQSENFKRFYRAVVSPTHVRVTAGGRIVPNTRTSAPPPFEWNGERFHSDSRKAEGERDQHNLQPIPWLHNAPPPSRFPQLNPGGFLPLPNLLPRGNSIAMATMTSQVQPMPVTTNSQLQPINTDDVGVPSQVNALPQQIKISPPTQFDQTKPFMYNGHLVYPVPPGFQPPPSALPVPMPMVGTAGFTPQSAMAPPAGFCLPQFPSVLAGMAGVANPFTFPPGQQLPMGIPSGMQPTENASLLTSYMPFLPPPAVSMSELIKSQIHFLQNGLKQMENNKNQIDEAFMEHQRGLIGSQISSLEAMLETQLSPDGAFIVPRGGENQGGSGTSASSGKENTVLSQISNNPTIAQSSTDTSTSAVAKGESAKPTAAAEPTQAEMSSGDKKPATRSESISKSRLTIAAAKAPPFQPRTQAAIAQASQAQLADEISRSGLASPEQAPFETQAQIEARLLARSSTDWGYSEFPHVAATASVTLSRTQSAHEPSTQREHEAAPPVFQKSNTFHGQASGLPMSPPVISPNAVPYLVGKLPNDIPAHQVKDTDLVYPRQLTADEIRARYLYWGKAPRSVQSGLPKFDGKDFYPPSPIKQDARLASGTPSSSITATVPQLNFDNLFDSPAKSSQKSLVTGRIAQYGQTWVPTQQAEFGSPENGYGSSSFRPGAVGMAEWSTHHGRLQEIPQQPQTPPRPIPTQSLLMSPVTEDFSQLFLKPGVPGYKTPSPLHNTMSQSMVKLEKAPVTPKNRGSPDESERTFETGNVDSENQKVKELAEDDASSTDSSVEFRISPQNKTRSQRASREISFAERVENFRRLVQAYPRSKLTLTNYRKSIEQQTLFLQNMLKNTTQTQMTSPALSGAVSSATAQGYLPQYRGSAAASLAPAIVNFSTGERDVERSMGKAEATQDPVVGAPSHANNFLAENRPLSRNRLPRPTPPPAENMGAEEYIRCLTQKDELDKKLLEKHWNPDESGTGPISGSDW